jgi:hypothetical protein
MAERMIVFTYEIKLLNEYNGSILSLAEAAGSVVSRLELYRTNVLLYSTYVLLACLTKVRR